MRKVQRSELLDLGAYEAIRERFRNRMIAAKRPRRVELGDHMSVVFENHDTILLQVQEMLRTERISDEKGIAHELETYNELIPEGRMLSATHFIEYDDEVERRRMLQQLHGVRERVHLVIGEERFTARFAVHHGEEMDRIPAVNYLSFEIGDRAAALRDAGLAVSLEVDHPLYEVRVELGTATRRALADDLED
ncbi:MAG: DUF3501 family protein [Myxococcales bacterium]|nr:DUF3501 family protein [Myxococcales bacterium]